MVEEEDDDNEDIGVSCRVSDTRVEVGEYVTFTADVSEGNSPFDYDWRGDIDGNERSERVKFSSPGRYDVRVTVTDDDGDEDSDDCSTVVVGDDDDDDSDLKISCSVNTTRTGVGQTVYWTTNVSGGNGNYDYDWSGSDSLDGNRSTISKSYSTTGTKTARVTVESGSKSKSLECPTVVIGSGVVLYQGPNQGNLASLSSVYLNQVPYTGVGDNPKFWAFILSLLLVSAGAAYATVNYKKKSARRNAIEGFKLANKLGANR